MEEGLTLLEVINLLKKKVGIMIGVTVLSLILTLIFTVYIVEPKYSANSQLMVEGTIEPQTQAELNQNKEAITMYQELIKSDEVIEDSYSWLVESIGFYGTKEELVEMIEIKHDEASPFFSVSVRGSDEEQATIIAQTVVNSFLNKVSELNNNLKVSVFSATTHTIDPNIPTFMSTCQLIVEGTVKPKTKAELDLSVEIISTYQDMLLSDNVISDSYRELVKTIGYKGSKKELLRNIEVNHNEQSQLFSISVTDTTSKQAEIILDTIMSTFVKKANVMNNNYKVSIFSDSATSKEPIFPNKPFFLAIGGVLGIILSIVIILVMNVMDKTISSPSFIEKQSDYPIIGKIKL